MDEQLSVVSEKNRLSTRFTIRVCLTFVAATIIFLVWNMYTQQDLMRDKVLTEARTLSLEIMASWDYINDSQDAINFNSDGYYDFKGIYCSIAGKNIAQRFTRQAEGYEIHFVRENPRSGTDEPDEFEMRAIELFNMPGEARESYSVADYNGKEVFRYTAALEIQNNCLSCHGTPIGEKDETGYYKEGMALGDLAGVISIVIPLDIYQREAQTRLSQGILFFLLLAIMVVAVVRVALRRWVVDPLNRSNLQLHDENKAQQDFLTSVSHELRTPLSSIIAFTDVWEKAHEDCSDEDRKMISGIKENSRSLLNMVNNTIDVAKIEAGRFVFNYDEVDLVDVISSITLSIEPLAAHDNITIAKRIADKTPIIITDQDALRKVLMNIVVNAVKYSPAGESVLIAVEQVGNRMFIAVTDHGIGIPEDKRSAVFERFVQAKSNDSKGSGLGLFLAKNLTESLGGTITLQSEIGKGSTFTVEFPLVAPGYEKDVSAQDKKR